MTISIGICVGASTVSIVKIALHHRSNARNHTMGPRPIYVLSSAIRPHEGNPRKTLARTLSELDFSDVTKIAATGRKLRHMIKLPSITEPEAVEYAFRQIKPAGVCCPAVISAGGETFMVYKLDVEGQITNVFTGNKCAAGTGEFFYQQIRRLGISLEQASELTAQVDPYPVSGRCSVFCKSDCTHATNKGIPKARVAAGLGRMMADKIFELLKGVDNHNIMLTGGSAQNKMMVRHLKDALPGLIVPEQAPYFEALGAAIWALDQPDISLPDPNNFFTPNKSSFDELTPLARYKSNVHFKSIEQDTVRPDDVCILGLDVGSTTTKAVLLRKDDHAMLASVYLRTNGDPIGASRECYGAIKSQIKQQIDLDQVHIIGIGICGSGRHIAGLHAITDGVINEITAHATAALYFDSDVDTILEIGGQDAKYTHITNGVPSDYAMNEACSAGTGSFLEESAWEAMGVAMEDIAHVAIKGESPPNFNDQCAAFIASDIKNAIHEGRSQEDIVAGLVYSICMNYNNRVKGHRPVGNKVFMQGGVCYNKAVPLAMAALTGKDIIVPPEPGLMGAFGVALEVQKRMGNGLMKTGHFDLNALSRRTVEYGHPFVCKGGGEKCDRRCKIDRVIIKGRTHPFGGACNRYENLRRGKRAITSDFNLIRARQKLIFGKYAPAPLNQENKRLRGRIGINRSFLIHSYYPLLANFFSALGFEPVLSNKVDKKGIDQRNAPFCFPAELSHGYFHSLIIDPDPPEYIFLPHFKSLPTINGEQLSQVCPLVQGEPFYLQTAFREQIQRLQTRGVQIFSPLLDLSKGLHNAAKPLVETALKMGIAREAAIAAFEQAKLIMTACIKEMQTVGKRAIEHLEKNPEALGVVLLGRPYNAYASEAHMGIPDKFASRGILVLPLDFLDFSSQQSITSMYWAMGQRIMMAARKIEPHPQLFGTYITNFSCGPDSFVLNYFRNMMGSKPSLTLELDSHSADAGIETRIDAFLDIVHAYRKVGIVNIRPAAAQSYQPASISLDNGAVNIKTSNNRLLPLTNPEVTMIFPSMGEFGTEALAASFRSAGIHALPLPPNNEAILKIGRGHTTCKECMPLILTTGALINYIRTQKSSKEVLVYFMPNGDGPCRFGQYSVFMKDLIKKLKIPDVAIFSLSSDEGYEGLPSTIHRRGWQAVLVSDVFEDIRAMLLTNAKNTDKAMVIFNAQFQRTLSALETGNWKTLCKTLHSVAARLKEIPTKGPIDNVPLITLSGEIFVRRDGLSRQYLTEYLADKGFAAVCTPVAEWILYSDYAINKGLSEYKPKGLKNKLKAYLKNHFMRKDEHRIKKIMSASGLIHAAPIEIDDIINIAKPYISPHLSGEAILTVGGAIREVASDTCGAIAIGPFGCMPNRISEAILNETMKREDKLSSAPNDRRLEATLTNIHDLPFLAIESDGSPLPQQIHAKLEAFCLRAKRLHQQMMLQR